MKIKDPCCCVAPVAVACRQLLKHIHVPELQVIMFVHMIIKPEKKTVLIKVIVYDLFTEIDMHFIIDYKRKGAGLKSFFTQGKLRKEIIPHSEIKNVSICQCILIQYFSPVPFLEAKPLHQSYLIIPGVPLQLLPGALFGL
jgi:hypothetical protein